MVRAIAIVVAAGLAAAAPAHADRIEQARDRALTSAYQRDLPRYEGAGSGAGSGSARVGQPAQLREHRIDTRERRAGDPGEVGSLMRALLLGLAVVVVVLVALWAARELMPRDEDVELPPDDAEPPGPAETAAIIERPLGDADELARRGELAEAIHALLLRTLEELVRTAAVRVERSHTSREILARVPLHADARDALAGLIAAVELTHFGDEPASAADYERCRQQFHRFAAAFRAGGLARRAPEAVPA